MSILWWPVAVLFAAVLFSMTAELVTAFFALSSEGRKAFDWNRRITRKFMLLILIAVSVVMDVVVYSAAQMLPDGVPLVNSGFLFFATTTLLWLFAAEVARIMGDIEDYDNGGIDVPPTMGVLINQIQWIVRSVRRIDKHRWQESGHNGDPPRRWLDDLTDEEVAKLVEMVETRRDREDEIAKNPKRAVKHPDTIGE